MRSSSLALPAFAFALMGCATAFRSSKQVVHVESDPAGAEAATTKRKAAQPTPTDVEIERNGTSSIIVSKPGYTENRGIVPKKMNAGWLTVDIATCVIPVALCIPLLIDAISGAWFDVDPNYRVALTPAGAAGAATAPVATAGPPPVATATPVSTGPTMSESERKAAARAAFMEGAQLQDKNDCAQALPRFEAAQKLYDAPTHLLHIGQCQAATGRLVEAHETFETLSRRGLADSAPEAFRQAQETAKKELPGLESRIPKLRVLVTPPPSKVGPVAVQLNGRAMPAELLGIARPVNPGAYRVTASSSKGAAPPVDVKLEEGTMKTVELKLPH